MMDSLDWIEKIVIPEVDIYQRISASLPQIASPIVPPDFEVINSIAKDVAERIERSLQQLPKLAGVTERMAEAFQKAPFQAKRLGQAGWVVTQGFSLRSLSIACNVLDSEGQEALDDLLVAYFEHEESGLFKPLTTRLLACDELQQWRPPLSDCLWAFEQGRYSLVIPVMLAIIEGTVTALLDQLKNGKARNAYKTWSAHANQPDPGRLRFVFWCSFDGFLSTIWSYIPFDGPPPHIVNRHWVHHGRQSDLHKKADAMRLLVALDSIVHNWEFTPNDGSVA